MSIEICNVGVLCIILIRQVRVWYGKTFRLCTTSCYIFTSRYSTRVKCLAISHSGKCSKFSCPPCRHPLCRASSRRTTSGFLEAWGSGNSWQGKDTQRQVCSYHQVREWEIQGPAILEGVPWFLAKEADKIAPKTTHYLPHHAVIRQQLRYVWYTMPQKQTPYPPITYVDDIIVGSQTEEQVFELYTQSKQIFCKGGFNLRKFLTSSRHLQAKINLLEHPECLVFLIRMKQRFLTPRLVLQVFLGSIEFSIRFQSFWTCPTCPWSSANEAKRHERDWEVLWSTENTSPQ